MLTAGELAAMQVTQNQTLVEDCSIMRSTLASDGAGGQTSSTTLTPSVCRMALSTTHLPSDQLIAGSPQGQVLWRITLPADADVRASDRINVGTRWFEVKGIYGPGTYTTALICVCVER